MAEQKLPKLTTRVRFPSPAPDSCVTAPDVSVGCADMGEEARSMQVTKSRRKPLQAALTVSDTAARRFATSVISWQRVHGRHDLPWQQNSDPYAIWLAEVMLQQTQVAAVIPYYQRFLARFPTCAALAAASLDDVMQLWSGLGYYSRARNLHAAARMLTERYGGSMPRSVDAIAELPGVGRSTAAAIAVFAFGARQAILDGNVKRVLCRAFGIEGDLSRAVQEKRLWMLTERLVPAVHVESYTQGLMDLGATVCLRRGAKCAQCPLMGQCVAYRSARVDALPEPRARKRLPQRDTVMLLLCHKAQVLLERRPASGIWGALWSLPEAALDEDPEQVCRDRFGVRAAAFTKLPDFEHVFTHFRLRIHPLRIDVRSLNWRASEPGHIWIAANEALGAAIPAPVRSILRQS
jgi:A/G-specific adenine glycosylase